MNKKIVFSALLLACLLVFVFSFGKSLEPKEFVIGVTLPLTGDLAFLGEEYKKGIDMAMSEVNNSNTQYTYKVIFEDDQFNATKGLTAAKKLLSVDSASALFTFGSSVGNAVSPLAETEQVIHINSIASDPNVAVGAYNFVHWTPPYKESELMTSELRARGIKNVVILTQNQAGALAVTRSLESDLQKNGIKIVASEKFNGDETDFRGTISRVKGFAPDMYIFEAQSPSLEIIAKQMRNAGIKTPFTSVETFEFTDQPELFEGMWYVNASDPTPEFMEKFKTVYGTYPRLGSGNGYDSIQMLVSAVEKVGFDEEKIQKELAKLSNYHGAMGLLSIDEDGIVVSDAVIRVIEKGVPKTLER